jgi:hexokinase
LLKLKQSKITDLVSDSTLLDPTVACGKKLFSTVADFIILFLNSNKTFLNPKPEVLPTGFTFSFPVKQLSVGKGTLTRWTKGLFKKNVSIFCDRV